MIFGEAAARDISLRCPPDLKGTVSSIVQGETQNAVTVKVEKLNPSVTLVFYGTVEMHGVGDEKTAVRFTVNAAGEVTGTNTLSKRLLTKAVKGKA